MPLSTVRTQRREIEEAGYISCHQNKRSQTITIIKWVNPREYSGTVYNFEDGDQEYEPLEDEDEPDEIKGDNKGDNKGVNKGDQNLTPLHINHISHITDQWNKGKIDLFEACARVYEKLKGGLITNPSTFSLMVSNFESNGVTPEDYGNAIIDMANNPKYKRATNPTSYEKYALGIADKRQNPVVANKRGTTPQDATDLILQMVERGEL